MEALARAIMRGKFEQIGAGYSQELKNVVARLLVVDPARRASVDEILCTQAVVNRMDDLPQHVAAEPQGNPVDLVNTIQVPRRFNDLTKNLPPSRYDTPLATPLAPAVISEAALAGRMPKPKPAEPQDVAALKPVPEAAAGEESGWQISAGPKQHRSRYPGPPPQRVQPPPSSGGGSVQQREPRFIKHPPLAGANRQRVEASPAPPGAGIKLPLVPGAQPRPGGQPPPTPSSDIRVVYHNPRNAVPYTPSNAGSNSSAFNRNNSSYNPITHQQAYPYPYAGAQYHSRNQPQLVQQQSRLARLHTGGQQYPPPPMRQRVAQPRYY